RRLLERGDRKTARPLPANGQGALRCAAEEARSRKKAADPGRVPTRHRPGPARAAAGRPRRGEADAQARPGSGRGCSGAAGETMARKPSKPAPAFTPAQRNATSVPTAPAIGPVTASESGTSPEETNESTLATRPRYAPGTHLWSSASHRIWPTMREPTDS